MVRGLAKPLHDFLQGLPDFRGRKRALKYLLPHLEHARSWYGPVLTVRPRDKTFLASYWGRYGSELKDMIEGMPPHGVFLDFGANTGVYSLVAARHLNSGMVIAVEPNPFVFRDLLNNIRLNDADNVTALNFAVGESTNLANFTFSGEHTGKGHLGNAHAGARSCSIVQLRADQFALLLPDLANTYCLCKIDTEGAELAILRALGAAGVLDKIDAFHIEINADHLLRFDATPGEIYEILEALGYRPMTDRRGRSHYDEIFTRK